MLRRRLLILLAPLVLASGLARASGRELLAIGSLDIETVDAHVGRERLRDSFLGGLSTAGFDLLPDEELTRKLEANPTQAQLYRGCKTEACLAGIGRLAGVRWVLAARIEVVGESYRVPSARILEVSGGRVVASITDEECAVCNLDEGTNFLSNLGTRLRTHFDVANQPPAAAIVAPAGPTRVERTCRWTGVTAGVLGLAALIGGFVAVAHDGACQSEPLPGACIQRVDTTGAQAATFVTGGVLLVGSAVLSYLGWRNRR
jgi:hypothetical protein